MRARAGFVFSAAAAGGAVMAWLLCGCSSQGGPSLPVDSGSGRPGAASAPSDIASEYLANREDGFRLDVLPETFTLGGKATLDLRIERAGEEVLAIVFAEGAQGLKALYCDVRYDELNWHPVGALPSPGFGDPVEVLSLSVFNTPGEASYGQILVQPDRATGFSGRGELARMRFAPGRALPRGVCSKAGVGQIPSFYQWRVNEFQWDTPLVGDYDRNGEVSISDLTPLAVHLGESPNPESGFIFGWSPFDGDNNGEIGISDLTPIGLHFGESVLAGFDVYRSKSDADCPLSAMEPNGPGAVLAAHVPGVIPDYEWDTRLPFNTVLTDVAYGEYYWVRTTPAPEQTPSISGAFPVNLRPLEDAFGAYYDQPAGLLRWYYYCGMDLDMDGMVAYSDIVPVAQKVKDGEWTIHSLYGLGRAFGKQVSGYIVYGSNNPDDYPDGQDGQPPPVEIATVPFELGQAGDPPWVAFVLDIGAAKPFSYMWLRPFTASGEMGTSSFLVEPYQSP